MKLKFAKSLLKSASKLYSFYKSLDHIVTGCNKLCDNDISVNCDDMGNNLGAER